jgi:metal-responsive CopG/Arc/MetJ family transcriptional regulator
MEKQIYKKISFNLPEKWVHIIDENAKREYKSRTQIIKDWLRARCLRPERAI